LCILAVHVLAWVSLVELCTPASRCCHAKDPVFPKALDKLPSCQAAKLPSLQTLNLNPGT